jgi:hypothetical protein
MKLRRASHFRPPAPGTARILSSYFVTHLAHVLNFLVERASQNRSQNEGDPLRAHQLKVNHPNLLHMVRGFQRYWNFGGILENRM